MLSKQAVLVFNPKSGKGRAARLARKFADRWDKRLGGELVLRPTKSRDDVREAAKETRSGDALPIFMGGDGTLSEAVQGLAEQSDFQPIESPIAFLPGGTGNSFLRDFGINNFETGQDALFRAIEGGDVLSVDVGILKYGLVESIVDDSARDVAPSRNQHVGRRLGFRDSAPSCEDAGDRQLELHNRDDCQTFDPQTLRVAGDYRWTTTMPDL